MLQGDLSVDKSINIAHVYVHFSVWGPKRMPGTLQMLKQTGLMGARTE